MTAAREPDERRQVVRQGDQTDFKPVDAKGRITQDWTQFQQKLLSDSRKAIKGRGADALTRLALEGMPSAYDAAVADSYMDQHRHARPAGEHEPPVDDEVSDFFDEFTPGSEALAEEDAICQKCGKPVPGTWTTFLICPTDGPQLILDEFGQPKRRASMVSDEDRQDIAIAQHASMEEVLEAARQLGHDSAWSRPLTNMEKVEDQTPPENEDVAILEILEDAGNDETAWHNPLDASVVVEDDDEAPPEPGVDPGGASS